MKKIMMLGTGGTIACKRGDIWSKAPSDFRRTSLLCSDAADFCQVDSLQIFNIDSTNMQPKHWLVIAKAIEDHYNAYDGFVICHGTDTMAYTAAALSYLVQNSPKPIVITGAQKPIDMENTDARTNLSDSFRFASDDRSHDVNIVFDGKLSRYKREKGADQKLQRIFQH